jgi:hypothetical protein
VNSKTIMWYVHNHFPGVKTWEEWLSAGWWYRENEGYRTMLGLWTHQYMWLNGLNSEAR